jgi:hypothetical protein
MTVEEAGRMGVKKGREPDTHAKFYGNRHKWQKSTLIQKEKAEEYSLKLF